jgi:hypothetical protein
VRFVLAARRAARDEKLRADSQEWKFGVDDANRSIPSCGLTSFIHTTRSGSRKGNGASSAAWTMVKTIVTAPMPSASVSRAAEVNALLSRPVSVRHAKRRSRVSVSAWERRPVATLSISTSTRRRVTPRRPRSRRSARQRLRNAARISPSYSSRNVPG